MTLSQNGTKWLRFIHLFLAILWTGGAFVLTLTLVFLDGQQDPATARGIHLMQKWVDDFVVIPGAMGCLLTGLCYGLFTRWGWFQHRWLTMKWVITVGGILFGTFYLGPRLNPLHELVIPTDSQTLNLYLRNIDELKLFGTLQLCSLIFACWLTLFKPWKLGAEKRTEGIGRVAEPDLR